MGEMQKNEQKPEQEPKIEAPPVQKPKSISGQNLKVYTKLLVEDANAWNALLVFLGSLSILFAIPFYPLYIVPILSLICGAVAYKSPRLGVVLGMIFAFPAFAFQSYSLGLIFLLALSIALFENEYWAIIAALQVLVFLPFTAFPLNIFGGFVMLGMSIAALNFGSRKSLLVSIPSVFLVLFLSTIWVYANWAYMPINLELYEPGLNILSRFEYPVPLAELPSRIVSSCVSLADFSTILSKAPEFSIAIGKATDNLVRLFISDSGLIQLISWTFVLYMISYSSGRVKGRFGQTISSLFLLLIPVSNYLISALFAHPFRWEVAAYAVGSIIIISLFDLKGIRFSKEATIMKRQQLKQFNKFGVSDLSLEGTENFSNIGGYEDVKEELKDAVLLPLDDKKISSLYGLKPPKGILLFGPPGTGKTMLVRALANEISYGLYYVNTAELLSKWYGESEKNLAELFENAKKNAPCIIMFDEIDTIGKNRSSSTDDVTPRVLSVLLQEIDGATASKNPVMVIGTTNIPNVLDPALLRPGRFDKIVYMSLPDLEARKQIFKVHLKKFGEMSEGVDYDLLAKKSERFSGADIKNIVNEAVKSAAKKAQKANAGMSLMDNLKGVSSVQDITTEGLLRIMKMVKPSVSLASLEDYDKFKMDYERRTSGGSSLEKIEEGKKENVRWADVAGLGEVKEAFLETIQIPLLHEDLMKEYKVKPSKGILLFGPPGCGKTLIVRAAANELNVSFLTVSGAELMKKGYTNAVNAIKDTFMRAKENTPCIVFLDEIETVAPSRDLGGGNIIGQLLTEMDGMKELKGVVVIGATNKPSSLDAAILRPGRFDKMFYISPPEHDERKQIFQINLGSFGAGVDLDSLAEKTEWFSGADIASVVQSAKMEILRARIKGGEPKITTETMLKIISGRKPSLTKSMFGEYTAFLSEYGERR